MNFCNLIVPKINFENTAKDKPISIFSPKVASGLEPIGLRDPLCRLFSNPNANGAEPKRSGLEFCLPIHTFESEKVCQNSWLLLCDILSQSHSELITSYMVDSAIGILLICYCKGFRASEAAVPLSNAYQRANATFGSGNWSALRHWWFIPRIKAEYKLFALARRQFYRDFYGTDVFQLPASTCVNSGGEGRAFLVFCRQNVMQNFLAQVPTHIPLPQSYGYDYNRAIAIDTAFCRSLFISATAALNPFGGLDSTSTDEQLRLAIEHILQIGKINCFGQEDICQMVIYLSKSGFKTLFEDESLRRECEEIGKFALLIPTVLCRQDLRLEIEAVFYGRK